MGSLHEGRLVAFSIGSTLIATALGVAVYLAVGSIWLTVAMMLAVVVALTLVVRRLQIGRWSFQRRLWRGAGGDHTVEVVFDERWVFLNRLTLLVDGAPVAHNTIWYGRKTLTGAGVSVEVGSGWIGECIGVVSRGPTGAAPLVETGPQTT